MKKIILYFCKKPLMVNVVMIGVLLMAIMLWSKISKEELPEFSMNFLRVTIAYPGASAQDVELFVTKPIEENLKTVSGLYEVQSTSSYGAASFRITVDPQIRDFEFREKVLDLKDAVERTDIPRETRDPLYSQFNSAEKSIIDLGLYMEGEKALNTQTRQNLQAYALAFKNKMLSLPEVSGVNVSGYLRPEIQIMIDPAQIKQQQVSMASIGQSIIDQHVRVPAGNMTDMRESEISLIGELTSLDAIDQTIVQSGFQGQKIKVIDLGKTQHGFERSNTVQKVQGHEAIVFSIKKSASSDILTAQKKIDQFTKEFLRDHADSGFRVIMMDDESYDVRNRLEIIGSNGLIGFSLIVIMLFLFLNFSTGFWVAMGIPFSLGVTLIGAMLMGFSINNMTLAAIIIVLGIVVDDAIIIGESVARRLTTSLDPIHDAIDSTMGMMKPVLASVLTTCAAFVPLYFFSGRFGLFVKYIPTVVILMLFASLIESAFLLPSHIVHPIPWTRRKKTTNGRFATFRLRFVAAAEAMYERFLNKILPIRYLVLLSFVVLLVGSVYIGAQKMKYVMFPREEPKEIYITATGPEGINRFDMADRIAPIEEMFLQEDIVEAVLSRIGQSRRGGDVKENVASIKVELLPPSKRKIPLKTMIAKWEEQSQTMEGLTEVRFIRSWWGSDSGSPIEIEIQENNDPSRLKTVEELKKQMEQFSYLSNVEIERPVTKREYKLHLNKDQASKLKVNFQELAQTIRSYVEGRILYTLINGDEEVDVRLTSPEADKKNIQDILSLYTSNAQNYLVPIRSIVDVEEIEKPANIGRVNFKRATKVYADIAEGAKITPLEVAHELETSVFPALNRRNPSTQIAFRGEIENSREAQGDFGMSVVVVLLLIYIILVFLFNSLGTPLLIGIIIPFGTIGVILAFMAHGMFEYGFFAVVGTLGMVGVVINDAIVMISQLEKEAKPITSIQQLIQEVSYVSATRLRPIILTTLTTVAGIFPTAYGIAGYDSMLAEMMLAMGWGLLFGCIITLILVPCIYMIFRQSRHKLLSLMGAK